jgi:hypothetical protein
MIIEVGSGKGGIRTGDSGLEENGDARKRAAAALRARRCEQIAGRMFSVTRTFAVDSPLSIAGSLL